MCLGGSPVRRRDPHPKRRQSAWGGGPAGRTSGGWKEGQAQEGVPATASPTNAPIRPSSAEHCCLHLQELRVGLPVVHRHAGQPELARRVALLHRGVRGLPGSVHEDAAHGRARWAAAADVPLGCLSRLWEGRQPLGCVGCLAYHHH